MRIFSIKWLLTIVCFASHTHVSAEPKKNSNKKATIVIQSQVRGSQEQPKVIYIMPWHGVNKPININNRQHQLVLPVFKPINPKVFRKQVQQFYQKSKAVKQ